MGRVVAVGLDAAEWWFVEQMMDAGEMPNLARLRAEGASCRLQNVVAYRSEVPWTQFVTGRTADQNKYWSTVEFDPATYGAECVGAHDQQPFYALGPDVEVVAFDLPHSVLRDDVPGTQVTAWGAHSAQYPRAARPKGTLREIDRRFGVHPALDNDYDGGWHQPRFIETLGRALVEGCRTRADICQWLMEEQPDWDLFLTVLSEPHSAGHHFWHGIDPRHPLHTGPTAPLAAEWIRRVHHVVDESVGRIRAGLAPDDHFLVFAVHGMQVNANDVPSLALLPELAHRLHFGEALLADDDPEGWARRGFPPVRPRERLNWREAVYKRFAATPAARRKRAVRLAIPDIAIDVVRRVQRRLTGHPKVTWDLNAEFPPESDEPLEALAAHREKLGWQLPHWYKPWWPQMRWFVLPTFSDAHVRINLAGREANGIVPLEDYDRTCDEIEAVLRQCTDPRTGRPAVAEVVRVRQHDVLDPEGPDADLVILWAEPCDALHHPDVGTIGPLPYLRMGEHSPNGFALVAGPGIEPQDLGDRSAFDVPRTIISLLGRQPDPALAGEALGVGTSGGRPAESPAP